MRATALVLREQRNGPVQELPRSLCMLLNVNETVKEKFVDRRGIVRRGSISGSVL